MLRDLLSGIGAEPEQTDDVSHCFSQVLPEAMRVRLRTGELGGYMEIDEVLADENVRHPIAVISNRPEAPSA